MDGAVEWGVVTAAVSRAYCLDQDEEKVHKMSDEHEPQGAQLD